MKKEKRDKGMMLSALDKASYSVGYVCAKVARVGDITGDKRWKSTVSASKGFMEKAAEKTSTFLEDAKDGASHIRESFMSGFESVKETISSHGTALESALSSHAGSKAKPAGAPFMKKQARTKLAATAKSKTSKKKLTPQEKKMKLKELDETSLNPDLEKEIARIDSDVSEVGE